MAFKMRGFRAKRSPLKVEDYDSLTEQEKAELYDKMMAEEAEKEEKALVHYSQTDLHIWFFKETDHATWENFLLLELFLYAEKPCHDRLKTTKKY